MSNNEQYGHDVILKTVTKLLVAPIQLFGLYVIMHGHISPGGGFQGGVMIASSFILVSLAYGYNRGNEEASKQVRRYLEPFGAFIFGLIAFICILLGANFLHYPAIPLLPDVEMAETAISVVEMGIGVTVTAMIFSMFMAIGGREKND